MICSRQFVAGGRIERCGARLEGQREAVVARRGHRLGRGADVPGAEHELLHLDAAGQSRNIFPGLDQRIAKHGPLHQPQAERQDHPAAEAGRQLRVHDHQPAAGAEQIPGVMQHREVMRDGVVGQAEHHAVERLGRDEFRGVLLEQIDVGPSVLRAKLARLLQHARRNIDAVNGSGRSDGGTQRRQIASGAASDLKDPTSRLQLEPFGGLLPESRRHEEKPIEQRNDPRDPVISAGNRAAVEIDPFVRRSIVFAPEPATARSS